MNNLLDAITTAVMVFVEQSVVFANRAAWQLIDYPSNPPTRLALSDVICPDFLPTVIEHLTMGDPIGQMELMLKTGNGCTTWVEFSAVPTTFEGQAGWVATMVDITARKHAEVALRESEYRFKGAFEYSGIGMALVSLEGKWLKVNRRIVEMLGYSEEELRATNFQELTHPDDIEADLRNVARLLRGEIDTFEMEKRYFAKDGSLIWALLSVSLVRDNEDRPLHFVSQVVDITAAKTLEAALHEINQRYDDLVAHIPAIVYRHCDLPDGSIRIDYISPRCRDLLGIEPDDVLQDPNVILGLVHPDDAASFWQASDDAARTFQPFVWEGRFLTTHGEVRWVRQESHPRQMDDGRIIWDGVHTDFTTQKQAEAALKEQERLRMALQKEQELSDLKTRMMIHISHEFRTPLSVIATSSDMLARYYARMSDAQRDERFQQIRTQIEHLTEMLDDVAYLVRGNLRQTIYEPNELDLEQLCQEVIRKLSYRMHDQVIEFHIAPGMNALVLDGTLVKRILLNLLTNALKFSVGKATVWLDVFAEGDRIVLRVRDQGIGIPAENQARIFEPFYRAYNVEGIGGLGLGLSIVRQAATLQGGSVTFESVEGQGSTFTVTLPNIAQHLPG